MQYPNQKKYSKRERVVENEVEKKEEEPEFDEEKAFALSEELQTHKEMYVPQMPIQFDQTGKVLFYESNRLQSERRLFRFAMVFPSVVLYCGFRAVQKRSWWRILFWTFPTLFATRIFINGLNVMSMLVTKMYLKEDGETIVIESMLWEGTPRKHVIKINQIEPHAGASHILQQFDSSSGETPTKDHFPIAAGESTFLIYKDGFCNLDKQVCKAIMNGYPIDTQQKTELTDDLLMDLRAFPEESQRSLVVLDI